MPFCHFIFKPWSWNHCRRRCCRHQQSIVEEKVLDFFWPTPGNRPPDVLFLDLGVRYLTQKAGSSALMGDRQSPSILKLLCPLFLIHSQGYMPKVGHIQVQFSWSGFGCTHLYQKFWILPLKRDTDGSASNWRTSVSAECVQVVLLWWGWKLLSMVRIWINHTWTPEEQTQNTWKILHFSSLDSFSKAPLSATPTLR